MVQFLPGESRDEPPKRDERFFPFLDAVMEDKTKAAQWLSEDRSLLEVRGITGETPLHFLAIAEEWEAVSWLLEQGADIDPVNEFGDTPLLEAAVIDDADLCRFLLEHGANIRYHNENDDSTALANAATAVTPAIAALKVLLEYLPADEDIDDYFEFRSWEQVWRQGGEAAELLSARGLSANR